MNELKREIECIKGMCRRDPGMRANGYAILIALVLLILGGLWVFSFLF